MGRYLNASTTDDEAIHIDGEVAQILAKDGLGLIHIDNRPLRVVSCGSWL